MVTNVPMFCHFLTVSPKPLPMNRQPQVLSQCLTFVWRKPLLKPSRSEFAKEVQEPASADRTHSVLPRA